MNYQYIKELTSVPRGDKTLYLIVVEKSKVSNITVISEYSVEWHCNKVTIHARKNGIILESRTFLNTNVFPRHIERTKTQIKIYLESFKHEDKSDQQNCKEKEASKV